MHYSDGAVRRMYRVGMIDVIVHLIRRLSVLGEWLPSKSKAASCDSSANPLIVHAARKQLIFSRYSNRTEHQTNYWKSSLLEGVVCLLRGCSNFTRLPAEWPNGTKRAFFKEPSWLDCDVVLVMAAKGKAIIFYCCNLFFCFFLCRPHR